MSLAAGRGLLGWGPAGQEAQGRGVSRRGPQWGSAPTTRLEGWWTPFACFFHFLKELSQMHLFYRLALQCLQGNSPVQGAALAPPPAHGPPVRSPTLAAPAGFLRGPVGAVKQRGLGVWPLSLGRAPWKVSPSSSRTDAPFLQPVTRWRTPELTAG